MCFFLATSYRGPGEDEAADHYAARLEFTENARIVGPVCIVIGSIMLLGSVMLCFLSKRVRKKEQTIGFHCPLHGDFYPLSPLSSSRTAGKFQMSTNSFLFTSLTGQMCFDFLPMN